MNKYVFDSDVLIDLFTNFYHSRFPSLWNNFDDLVNQDRLLSVREVKNELNSYHKNDSLKKWINRNNNIFKQPDEIEMVFIKKIFAIRHFQAIIRKKSILNGKPVADPFLIAKAKAIDGFVVTQEKFKDNGAKIPNICKYFNIKYINLEGFMEKEEWKF